MYSRQHEKRNLCLISNLNSHFISQSKLERKVMQHRVCAKCLRYGKFYFVCIFCSSHSQRSWKEKKELDLQQKSLICGLHLFDNTQHSLIPEETKSVVISNFLIVIVFVLYCVPLWLFYDLFMKFMLFSFLAPPRALGTRGSLLCFLN